MRAGRMWKIGGEGAARYPRDWNVVPRPQLCADSSLLFIRLSILFSAPRSSLLVLFPLLPFSRLLLAVDTCFRPSFPLSH